MDDGKYVVLARFDAKTDQKRRALQASLREECYIKAISEWPPHITIAAYESAPIDEILQWTSKFSLKHSKFDIMLPSLGIFPPGGEHKET